jgi:hypothetical protein
MGVAVAWLEENPSVREFVLHEVDLDGKPLPDALLADPRRLVEIVKGVVIEAVRRDAPQGVVEELMVPVRRMARTAAEIERYRHITDALSEAQGLRDRYEFEPVLEKALATAPDDANRQKLQLMLDALKRADNPAELQAAADDVFLGPDEGSGTATEFSPVECLVCCSTACVMCLPAGCLVCCPVGCLLCA